jgi:hypothetical protein
MRLQYTEEFRDYLKPDVCQPHVIRVEHENPENKDEYLHLHPQYLAVKAWIKKDVGINDLEWLNHGKTTLFYSFMYPYTESNYVGTRFNCFHSVLPYSSAEMKKEFEDTEKKYPGITKEMEDAAIWYYSMLFSMLSNAARLDIQDQFGKRGVQVACCYETCAFLLAYAALRPDSEQSKMSIPLAFSNENLICRKPVNKQRLLQLVEEWIPSLLESSIRTGKNTDSPFVQSGSAIQTSQIFDRFKSMIPNLGEPDQKLIVTEMKFGVPTGAVIEMDISDPEALGHHSYEFQWKDSTYSGYFHDRI